MNKIGILLLGSFSLTLCTISPTPSYKKANLTINERVEDLLQRMTVEEKFWQLFMIPGDLQRISKEQLKYGIFGFQTSASAQSQEGSGQMMNYEMGGSAQETAKKINSIQRFLVEETRLGIPGLFFDEALHGLVREGATAFPQSIALAATFDTSLMRQVAQAIAAETKSRGIRQILSPVVNLALDVRWGRTEETYGEDPFLASLMGVTFVSSFEQTGIVTTPKHFASNVGSGGRDSYPIFSSLSHLSENEFAPFRACFQQGGSRSVMTAYNSINGEPCSSNKWLLRKILREKWGFKGFVISDAGAVGGLLDLHHIVRNREESAKAAYEGGLDVIFQTDYNHYSPLLKACISGSVSRQALDDAVRNVLRVKFELGLFEEPYVNEEMADKINNSPKHRRIALDAAIKSMTLLKNKNNTLPLSKRIRKIALLGKEATAARLGGYSGPGNNKVSIKEGLEQEGHFKVLYATGYDGKHQTFQTVPSQYLFTPDGKTGLSASYYDNPFWQGKPVKTRIDKQLSFKWTLFPPVKNVAPDWFSVRWEGKIEAPISGKIRIGIRGNDGYRLFINNKLVLDHSQNKQTEALEMREMTWVKGQKYALKIEFYETRKNSLIQLVWDYGIPSPNLNLQKAVALAKQADMAIVVAGIHEGEFQDRAFLSLPPTQEELIQRVAATKTPTVVLLTGGSAITMSRWIDKVDAILMTWYAGEAGGTAVAKTLTGEYNPAGRLPITFPLHEAQLPLVYNHYPTGRGNDYHNLTGKPLFPFGFGLSYTSFSYSNLKVTPQNVSPDDTVRISCDVMNTGRQAGEEVAQLYVQHPISSVVRPVIALKGISRIAIKPHETQQVSFLLPVKQLGFFTNSGTQIVEKGKVVIKVGSSSKDLKLKGEFQIQ